MCSGLIAYFSRSGKNLVGGQIVDLSVGNTAVLAQKLHRISGGDLFEIEPIRPYPLDYVECTQVALWELRSGSMPILTGYVPHIEEYRLICLAYPNWWNTLPMPVCSFLRGHNLRDKVIMPFCTHEGGGFGESVQLIRRLCPTAVVLEGLAVLGGDLSCCDTALTEKLKSSNLI